LTSTDWYFNYYESGLFLHQQRLCEAVAWTKYNLEGQVAAETSLSPSSGNPLTIRLLAVREALGQLTDYVGELDSEIKAITKKQFETNNFSGLAGTYYGKGDSSKSEAAPVEIIKFDGEEKEINFKYIIVQSALYKFFSNFGSVLDRLAFEIDLIYE
jgi:hypothetical protein